jgi:aminobenzoyl-glutamate transport protein
MNTLGLYIVLVFFAAQFVAFFGWTNLGAITAVSGADLLRTIGLTGPAVFVPFILICAFVNLMLGSASAQWAVTAPIFVPMLMEIIRTTRLILPIHFKHGICFPMVKMWTG